MKVLLPAPWRFGANRLRETPSTIFQKKFRRCFKIPNRSFLTSTLHRRFCFFLKTREPRLRKCTNGCGLYRSFCTLSTCLTGIFLTFQAVKSKWSPLPPPSRPTRILSYSTSRLPTSTSAISKKLPKPCIF